MSERYSHMTYKIPKGIILNTIKEILAGRHCAIESCLEIRWECVLQGTTPSVGGDNEVQYLNADIFLARMVEYKIITKAQALELTLDYS